MKSEKDIKDNEIRVIGGDSDKSKKVKIIYLALALLSLLIIAAIITLSSKFSNAEDNVIEESYCVVERVDTTSCNYNTSNNKGFIKIEDTIISNIPLRLYTPYYAKMELHIGSISNKDTSIIYAAQAADIRADNGGIVGSFISKGELKARGLSKQGFCAIIDGDITVGVAQDSPLFERAIEMEGDFFRQYPLVKDGKVVENIIKNKSIRRALCSRDNKIFMVETLSAETFHNFSQSLVNLGVSNAIYLVGSNSYGWAIDRDGYCIEFGDKDYLPNGFNSTPEMINYIVWR